VTPAGSETRNRISLIFPVALSSELPCENGAEYKAARQRQQRSLLSEFFGLSRKPVTPAPLKPDS